MKQEKRNEYKLTASFHTLELKAPTHNLREPQTEEVDRCATTIVNARGTEATARINPNKFVGDLFTFAGFQNAMKKILDEIGIDEHRLMRADMRFDNYNKEHYKAFSKLNKYLISAMACTYKVKNCYRTEGLFTGNQISIAIKNDYFELENYDRKHKNEVTGNTQEIAKSRIEERTKTKEFKSKYSNYENLDFNMNVLLQEFTNGWGNRWDKAKKNLKMVQEVYNDELVKKYYQGLNTRPVQFRSLTDFIIQNQDSIFTSMQMIDLLKRLGVDKPEERAKYHKKKYGIEYFSQADVEFAIKEIKRATTAFFGE